MKLKHLLLIITFISAIQWSNIMACTLEDIQTITNGKGVFSVTINNKENYKMTVGIHVELINPPQGYENMVGYTDGVSVEANSSVTILLPKPLVSKKDNYEEIKNYDNREGPKLSDDSRVVINVGGGSLDLQQSFQAHYVSGTTLIEVSDTVFNIALTNDFDLTTDLDQSGEINVKSFTSTSFL